MDVLLDAEEYDIYKSCLKQGMSRSVAMTLVIDASCVFTNGVFTEEDNICKYKV